LCLTLQALIFGCPKGVRDIFTLVINFLGKDCVPKPITIGLFETFEILDQALATNLQDL
jgi:hypothetical protein